MPAPRSRPSFVTVLLIALCPLGCGERAPEPPPPFSPPPPTAPPAPTGPPAFSDVTEEVGLHFTRFDARTPDANGRIAGGRRMSEWTGGGVVAFDYDLDGRPDLLFPQGCEWTDGAVPPSSEPNPAAPADRRGRLFRNVDGEQFEDVTDAAGLVLTGYGQGAAAGDLDGDGFPDLFVCNAGTNRLLRNEGDGTFTDVTAAAGLTPHPDGTDWTVSAAIADLNGDGLPDIYEANYLTGRDVYTKICRTGDDPPRACSPNGFPAAADRLWLNLGTGLFAEATDLAGLAVGPGLGVLATDLDGRPGNEIYVANDQRPNHLYIRTDDRRGGPPQFREAAVAAGVATSGAGESEAGMGLAAADLNADGRPDLFVTNYEGESNTLYTSLSRAGPLLYEDATRRSGLFEPGYETLGFGAAFLDHDADGDEDLIYVNGHIDDFTHRGSPLFMRPALLENVGGGRFEPVPPVAAGAFFDTPALGRGLARLDWNGDGRDECVATRLNGPAVLLKNEATTCTTVSLRLVGTTSDRDAVGAAVTVSAPTAEGVPSGPRTKWITAGDGYLSGDEKRLTFGLGATPSGTSLDVSVRWPGGATERFAGVTAAGRFLLVQGAGSTILKSP
ncbi:CRTAC1 family protein [Alienimonas californiensis]|uniref:FG-GAP repeat protein n=1 Tax=Alienimonas californiensis TaxID=2527989 RepID=A0A517P415_9PLAN|nr:CRTAC1 family protein [Alienimonas californiensis]QDT14120.1 FG-GAP repeat protein [Alienimonas californiensis]